MAAGRASDHDRLGRLFLVALKDMYSAEKQMLGVMWTWVDRSNPTSSARFWNCVAMDRTQVERLEGV